MIQKAGINLSEDLEELARKNPKYAEYLGQLAGIDQLIKNFVKDTVDNYSDADIYYIKTELLYRCYNLYLYNSERNATLGYSWLLDDFLQKCQNKFIEPEIEKIVLRMIDKFDNDMKLSSTKINWLI